MLTFKRALPEETGIPSTCIINFTDRLTREAIPMHSLLLLHHDQLITEAYYAPCRADTLHRMFSISKSLTSIAIGLLEAEGKLSLADRIVTHFPDKVPADVHPYIAEMTIRDMLMMRTCHASTTYKLDMTTDWVESFFTTPPTHPAGRIFHYDTSSAHTLCALAERLSGMPLLSYLREKLPELAFSEEAYMLKDPFGISLGGSGLVATSLDILKFGYLIYHRGFVEGRQLVPAAYIDTATSFLTDTRMTAPVLSEAMGYGYQFWRNQKGGYTCYGMGGQLIIFLPEYDMICVTTADTQGIGGGNQAIYNALYEEILPHIKKEPLPVNSDISSCYQQTLSRLHIAPLQGGVPSLLQEQINGSIFSIAPNPMGFTDLSVTFSSPKGNANSNNAVGALHFTLQGTPCRIDFGFGHLVTGIFPVYEQFYGASAVWVTEDTLYIKAHVIDAYVGSVHFELSFGNGDVTVFMKKQEESLFKEFNGHLYGTI